MQPFLAMVVYRCVVDGQPSTALDISTRFYLADSVEGVRKLVIDSGGHGYKNSDGELVEWELREIMAIEPFEGATSGEEVVGFIAELDELGQLVDGTET